MLSNAVVFFTYTIEFLISLLYYGNIAKKKHKNIVVISMGLGLFWLGAFLNVLLSNVVLVNTLYHCLCNWLFFVLAYDVKKLKALFHSIVLDVFSMATEFASIYLVSALTQTDVKAYLSNLTFYVIDLTISKTLYFFIVLIIIRFIKTEHTKVNIPIPFYLYPFVIIANLFLNWTICTKYTLSEPMIIGISVVSVITLLTVVILFLFYQSSIEKENEYFLMQKELYTAKMEKEYYDILEQRNNDLQVFVHDMKNHLYNIAGLTDNDPEKAKEYVVNLTDDLSSAHNIGSTSDKLLDLIVDKYSYLCKKDGIKFESSIHFSGFDFVDDSDKTAILNNLLDNAIESAGKCKDGIVKLVISQFNNVVTIKTYNTCMLPPRKNGRVITSSKDDKKAHGYGMKSIIRSAKKYGGDLDWEYKDDEKMFVATVMLAKNE